LKVIIGTVLVIILLLVPVVTYPDDVDYINKSIERIETNIDIINVKIDTRLATKDDVNNILGQIKDLKNEVKENKIATDISDKVYGVAIAELKVRLGLIGVGASAVGTSGVLGIRFLVGRRRNGNGNGNGKKSGGVVDGK